MKATVMFPVLVLVALPLVAQHAHAPAPNVVTELHPGLGNYHYPITTKSPEAQTFFDQGLTLLYGFNHDEAARYFRRVIELDPDAAMAQWGLAMAIGPNYNDVAVDAARAASTYEAVQRAVKLAPKANDREQAMIAALTKRYPSPEPASDWMQFHLAYSEAMREVSKKYPDDLDAAMFFAESLMMLRPWQLWSLEGEPAEGTLELVAVLESVLKRNPDHPGANHFYIHAVEASRNLERAIPSAYRLMTLAPGAGHLVHMPGHIFLQTGDFDLAAKTNIVADDADKAFVDRTGATGIYPLMYWTHNVHFVSYARAQEGKYEEAKQAALKMVRQTGDADLEMQMLEAFHLYPLVTDLRFHKWDEILRTPEPIAARKFTRAFWEYSRAMAFSGKGEMKKAQAERAKFEASRKALSPDLLYLGNNKAVDVLALAAATLDAQMADDPDLWRKAVELESTIKYDEPPAWHYPVRQSLGASLLRKGKPVEAEKAFREAMEQRPRDGRLLYGLWQSLTAQKRDSEAALVEQQYRVAWKNANPPEL